MDMLIAHGGEKSREGLAGALAGLDGDLVQVGDGERALELLMATDAPLRVALVDWDLGGIEGPEICRLVRDFHLKCPPYVILLAGAKHHAEVALGFEAGADDCVRTPVAAAELRARVAAGKRSVELPRGRSAALTADPGDLPDESPVGVGDRVAILRRLEEEIARSLRDHADLSIGLLDVDGLSRVGEWRGRAASEAAAREVVRRARSVLRPYDAIGRTAGEQFLIILPKTDDLDIEAVLDRLRMAMLAEPFVHAGKELDLTVSIGGATGSDESARELVEQAERSLGEAKARGRDCVVAGRPVSLEAVLTRD